jgi:hypothetical protein
MGANNNQSSPRDHAIIVIACSGKKATHPCAVKDLYQGQHFKMCLKWARSVVTDENIRVLSAKHGLLKLDDVIEPYDQKRFSHEPIVISGEVWFLGSTRYFRYLGSMVPHAKWVFGHLPKRDIGFCWQWMVNNYGRLPAGERLKTTALWWALFYAEHYGWKVFPARPDDKYSYNSAQYSNGRKWGATNDPEQLRRDFAAPRCHDARVGILTGKESGIVVIDVDTIEGHGKDGAATLRQILEEEKSPWPETLTAISPARGRHYYFEYPSADLLKQYGLDEIKIGDKLGPGIDVQADDDIAIAYPWENDAAKEQLPLWLMRRFAEISHKPTVKEDRPPRTPWRRGRVAEVEVALAGVDPDVDRGNWFEILCAIRNELGDVDGLALADRWSSAGIKYRDGKPSDQLHRQWPTLKKGYNFNFGTIIFHANKSPDMRDARLAAFDQAFIDGTLNTYAGSLPDDADVLEDEAQEKARQADGEFINNFTWELKSDADKDTTKRKPPSKQWPTIDDAAYHGFAGKVVSTISPHSEADPVALLTQFLTCFGNAIGRFRYFQIESDRHYANIFNGVVGATKQRKNVALNRVGQCSVMPRKFGIRNAFEAACRQAKD